ncbi:MAG: YbjN domain-containing protein [Vulcanimicrobiaceae bacterium]
MSDEDDAEIDVLEPVESALEDEGLLFTREDDEDAMRIAFRCEGDRYFVVSYRDDPTFVMLGSGWSLPEGVALEQPMEIANGLNVRKKFVKTAIWEEERDVLFTVELCVTTAEEIRPHFGRLLDVLRDTAGEFFTSLGSGDDRPAA